jgi:hypothetical protein
MLVTVHSSIPSIATHLARNDEHHQVIGSCIQIKQTVMGGEAEIISRGHDITHSRSEREEHSRLPRDIILTLLSCYKHAGRRPVATVYTT